MRFSKRLLFIIPILILFSFAPSSECQKHFKGKWKYDLFDEKDVYVKRTNKKQYEYVSNGKYYYEFDINWISDCQYELTYVGTTSPQPGRAEIGEKLIVDILNITETTMQYRTVFRDEVDAGGMTKIN